MGLRHLPAQTRHNNNGYATIFNNTWGHFSPQKNTSYKGIILFCVTDHSQYGCQPIIMTYDFPNLEGPYIHDELFEDVCDWEKKFGTEFKPGIIYKIELTFRNYRFYYGKVSTVLDTN